MSASSDFKHDSQITTGVLITNLGTPDAPTASALRRYLAEFLWDPRIVDSLPRPIWWLALHGLILRIRPPRSAKAYASVWTDEGSPLLAISKRQLTALRAELEMVREQAIRDVAHMREQLALAETQQRRLHQADGREAISHESMRQRIEELESSLAERLISPYLIASQAIPVIAIAPLLTIWVTSTYWARVLVAALVVFFPILINIIAGMRSVPAELYE